MRAGRSGREARPGNRVSYRARWTIAAIAAVVVAFLGRGAYQRVQHRRLLERVGEIYVAGECTVTSKDVHTIMHTGSRRRDGQRRTHAAFEPLVRYRYRAGGRDLQGERFSPEPTGEHDRTRIEELLRRYEVGQTYPCWYDPDRPEEAFLERQPVEVVRREEPES